MDVTYEWVDFKFNQNTNNTVEFFYCQINKM